jgi:hypothetical protein
LGRQFATLGANVPAFINNLGPNNKPKMLKVGPKFWALTPSVKWALGSKTLDIGIYSHHLLNSWYADVAPFKKKKKNPTSLVVIFFIF